MKVYFVPLAAGRFEPYFEHDDAGDAAAADPGQQGFFARMSARFSALVRDAERLRHEQLHEPPKTTLGRLQRRLMCWIAERVAEQRLLWRLRSETDAVLHVPVELEAEEGLRLFRHGLQKDADHHLRRLALHTLGLVASAPLVFVPGPNVLGYLFNALHEDAASARAALAASVGSLVVTAVLVWQFGLVGACWSMVLRYVVHLVTQVPLTVRVFRRLLAHPSAPLSPGVEAPPAGALSSAVTDTPRGPGGRRPTP